MNRIYIPVAVVLTASLALAACSGGSDEAAPTTVAATTTTRATSTTTSTSTTVPATTTSTVPPITTTTVPDVLRMPLTGEPIESAAEIPDRPALAVKIPVDAQAMPHSGLNDADIVFETIINDNFTRLIAVFHSGTSDPVGPIRSGRAQDVDLLSAFNTPLMAWSGGNRHVTGVFSDADADDLLVDLGHPSNGGLYYRRSGRSGAPHNLFSSTDLLWSAAPEDAEPPVAVFSYLRDAEILSGAEATSIELTLDSIDARWEYDAETGEYLRFHEGREHMTEFDGQVSATNVVVLMEDYGVDPADGNPLMQSKGSNQALVFSGGVVRTGVWLRFEGTEGFFVYDNLDDLNEIRLSPGRTWVELPRNIDGVVSYADSDGESTPVTTAAEVATG